jgi:hypothetical protein
MSMSPSPCCVLTIQGRKFFLGFGVGGTELGFHNGFSKPKHLHVPLECHLGVADTSSNMIDSAPWSIRQCFGCFYRPIVNTVVPFEFQYGTVRISHKDGHGAPARDYSVPLRGIACSSKYACTPGTDPTPNWNRSHSKLICVWPGKFSSR